MRRILALLFCSLCCTWPALFLAGCGDGKPDDPGTEALKNYKRYHPRLSAELVTDDSAYVVIATADKAQTLDPHNTSNGGDVKVINQIYQRLLRVHPDDVNQFLPELATAWEVAEDGRTITFTIRDGVVFHDGATLNAAAVKLSLDRLLGRTLDVPIAPYRGEYGFIDEIIADGKTLTITLNKAVPRVALRNLSMFPASVISPKLLATSEHEVVDAPPESVAAKRSTFIAQWAAGTGAFALSRFSPEEAKVRLLAFDEYWGGKPAIERLLFRQIEDPNAQIQYLKSREADMLDDPPRAAWDQLAGLPEINLRRFWALNVCYLGVNVKHEKTGDIRVRQAIRLAVDPEAWADELYFGTARPTYSLVARTLPDYDPNYKAPGRDQPRTQRLAEARNLLDEAGALGRSMKIYFPASPRPYLPTPEKVADKLRQQLNEAGLNVEIVKVPNAELFNSLHKDEYELVLIGWMSDNADPDNFYMPLASGNPKTGKPAPTNAGRTFDADIHDAMVAAQMINDQRARVAAYRAIERTLQEDLLGYVPLLNTQQAIATGPRLSGVEIDPLGQYRFYEAKLR